MSDLRQDYRDAVAPVARAPWPPCACHAERPADAACAVCERLYCWECLRSEVEEDRLICVPCRQAAGQKEHDRRWLRLAAKPYLWVLAISIAGLICYLTGVGNPEPESESRRDKERPWHQRRTAVLWLRQAGRVSQRVNHLREHGSPAERMAWARLEADALERAAVAWKGEEPEVRVRIAEALALADAGEGKAGWEALRELAPRFAEEQEDFLPYLLHRGRLAIEVGETEAGVADWRTILQRTADESLAGASPGLDAIIDGLAKGMVEGGVSLLLGQISRTDLSELQVREETLDLIMQHGLSERFADVLGTRRKADPDD